MEFLRVSIKVSFIILSITTEMAEQLKQAETMAQNQLSGFIASQEISFKDFTRAVQYPNFYLGDSSPLSSVNNARYTLLSCK